jgi:hypothetical protein
MSAPAYPVYPDVNTSAVSNTAANHPDHRRGECVDGNDQLASPVLLGIGAVGSAVACLLIRLVLG